MDFGRFGGTPSKALTLRFKPPVLVKTCGQIRNVCRGARFHAIILLSRYGWLLTTVKWGRSSESSSPAQTAVSREYSFERAVNAINATNI